MKAIGKFFIRLIMIIAWVFVCIFVTTFIVDEIYQILLNEEIYYISSSVSAIPIVLAMAMMFICYYIWFPDFFYEEIAEEGKRFREKSSIKKRVIITVLSVGIFLLGTVVSSLFYEEFTTDGVIVSRLGKRKIYTWNDVAHYTLKADIHGVLVFSVYMEDGEQCQFNGGLLRGAEYTSESFDKIFPEDSYDYMPWLAETLKRHEKEFVVEDWEKLLEDLQYTSWEELAEEVRDCAE